MSSTAGVTQWHWESCKLCKQRYNETCEIRTPLEHAKSVPNWEVSSFHRAICTENSSLGPDKVSLFYRMSWFRRVAIHRFQCTIMIISRSAESTVTSTPINSATISHACRLLLLPFTCPNSTCWVQLAGIRQDTLCMLVTVCFHNLVTYAQRLQDLYSACLMFWMRTHTGPRFIVSSEGRPTPNNSQHPVKLH
jgi:hypothetical protein